MSSCSLKLGTPSPKIEIKLEKQTGGLEYYTTGSVVTGTVSVALPYDLTPELIQIYLQGISQTKFHRALQHGRANTQHTFLSLRQPSTEMKIPIPFDPTERSEYVIPFSFVIPNKLPPASCNHFTKSEHIEDSHRNLPATMGDRDCLPLADDFSTDMARISYCIRVKIINPLAPDSLHTKTKCIRVIPATPEEPPIETMGSQLYITQKEKLLGRGPFRNHSGRLSVEASQPRSIRLPDSAMDLRHSGTKATINLVFIGTTNPPSLQTITSSLRVLTIYGATPWENHPDVSYPSSLAHGNRGLYRDDLPLSKLCVKSVEWKKHELSHDQNDNLRLEFYGSESDASKQLFKYTSSIVVPINLPEIHRFVPSFHSCFLSRLYLVELCLSYRQHGMACISSSTSLKVPLQITH